MPHLEPCQRSQSASRRILRARLDLMVDVSRRDGNQFGEQCADASVDLVSDRPDLFNRLAGRVGQLPIEVALPRRRHRTPS